LPPQLTNGVEILGSFSGATGTISAINRNGVVKGFDTFIQLYKYLATQVSGVFIQNEVVTQGGSTGYVHHVEGSGGITIYIDGMSYVFAVGQQIVGQTSGAIATLNTMYPPELVPGAGHVQYVENISPVTRANTQSETFQIIMNF